MKIACMIASEQGATDRLLYAFAHDLLDRGHKVSGTVQINTDHPDSGPCDMDMKVLPDGPLLRISQSLGRGARGCRLNPDALETAVGHVAQSLDATTDCLIINKFGKQEAEGRGFRDVIAEALVLGVPVIVGLNTLNEQAFEVFSGGLAVNLPPDAKELEEWLHSGKEDLTRAVAV
jgi:hypothetical protein